MSLPSWLKNVMGSPNPQGDFGQAATQTLGQALGIAPQQPFNGYPGGLGQWSIDQAVRQAQMGVMNTGTAPQPPRYRGRVAVAERLASSIADKIVAELPPTAAIRIAHVEVVHGGDRGPEVLIEFAGRALGDGIFALPLTEDFPTDADISRILLAMP